MKLIILGSGTTVPSVNRGAAAYYLVAGGLELLVDCGSGALVQLERAGGSYRTLDVVCITHTHPDHIGDLARLVHALKFTPGFQREKPLDLFGPRGFSAFFDEHVVPLVGKPGRFPIRLAEVGGPLELAGLRALSAPTLHSETVDSVAYRFEADGRSLVLSGDCDYDRSIVEISRGADLLVIDCSFPDALKMKGHLSASECGRVASEAEVGRVVLSHLYPLPSAEDKRLEQAKAVFCGEVQLAADLMEIEL